MSLVVSCPSCNAPWTIEDGNVGRTFRCSCGAEFTVRSSMPPPLPPQPRPHSNPLASRRTLFLAVVALTCLVMLCGGAFVLMMGLDRLGGKKVYSREGFRQEFMGASPEMVRLRLGQPDEIMDVVGHGRCWLYRHRTKDADGAVDDRVSLCFNHRDRVYFVSPIKH